MGGPPVPKAERTRRNRVLRLLSEQKRRAFYRAHLGQTRPVLWEGGGKDGTMRGFTDNYIQVSQPFDAACVGQVVPVRLAGLAPDGTIRAEDAAFVPLL
jgi:threonylcarbamoyladenosine tRNA methylthiotransferase MtaB